MQEQNLRAVSYVDMAGEAGAPVHGIIGRIWIVGGHAIAAAEPPAMAETERDYRACMPSAIRVASKAFSNGSCVRRILTITLAPSH